MIAWLLIVAGVALAVMGIKKGIMLARLFPDDPARVGAPVVDGLLWGGGVVVVALLLLVAARSAERP